MEDGVNCNVCFVFVVMDFFIIIVMVFEVKYCVFYDLSFGFM